MTTQNAITKLTEAAQDLPTGAYEELEAAIAYASEHGIAMESGAPLDTEDGVSDWTWIDAATYPEADIATEFVAIIEDEGAQGYYCYASEKQHALTAHRETIAESIERRLAEAADAFIAGTPYEVSEARAYIRYMTTADICELWNAWGVSMSDIEQTLELLEDTYEATYEAARTDATLDARLRTIAATKFVLGRAEYYGDLFTEMCERAARVSDDYELEDAYLARDYREDVYELEAWSLPSAADDDDIRTRFAAWLESYRAPRGAWLEWIVEEADMYRNPERDGEWICDLGDDGELPGYATPITDYETAQRAYDACDPLAGWWHRRLDEAATGEPHVDRRYEVSLVAQISSIDYDAGEIVVHDYQTMMTKSFEVSSRAGRTLARSILADAAADAIAATEQNPPAWA